ncbi:MAG: hypothetical protein U5O39_15615 [Gammaproteobacteria bacterium]|nr:hypothetical protein [Gammaproteobacteria bacterium]
MRKTLANSLARSVGGEVIETHISWLVLLDDEALKIKKPVDLGFLATSRCSRHESISVKRKSGSTAGRRRISTGTSSRLAD